MIDYDAILDRSEGLGRSSCYSGEGCLVSKRSLHEGWLEVDVHAKRGLLAVAYVLCCVLSVSATSCSGVAYSYKEGLLCGGEARA
ncbi:unnamed protein product [Dovyalis caffra]|uniref:Uncharacterized protein n=1 Tax=Dovyalis caffra TaxID=77055 RepID=A0AAV1QVE1_9ROSI|nr:unnamed protein product [Dovyalis caffra]